MQIYGMQFGLKVENPLSAVQMYSENSRFYYERSKYTVKG